MRDKDVVRLYESTRDAAPTIRIPVQENLPYCSLAEFGDSPAESAIESRTIELTRQHFSFHIAYEELHQIFSRFNTPTVRGSGFREDIPIEMAEPLFEALIPVFRPGVGEFIRWVNQSQNQQYPSLMVNRIDFINQPESGLLLFDVLYHTETEETAQSATEMLRNLMGCCLSSIVEINYDYSPHGGIEYRFHTDNPFNSNNYDNSNELLLNFNAAFPLSGLDHYNPFSKGYDDKAEEKAMELLKDLLTPKQFNMYKDKDYFYIKGKWGRKYKVQKQGMMEVTQKIAGRPIKKYRLCMEPTSKYRRKICPTDEVIAKVRLIKSDEKLLHKKANKFTKDGNVITSSFRQITIMCKDTKAHIKDINLDEEDSIKLPKNVDTKQIGVYCNGNQLEMDVEYYIKDNEIIFK